MDGWEIKSLVNSLDPYGWPPPFYAIYQWNYDMTYTLLQNFDLRATDSQGHTALHMAAINGTY